MTKIFETLDTTGNFKFGLLGKTFDSSLPYKIEVIKFQITPFFKNPTPCPK